MKRKITIKDDTPKYRTPPPPIPKKGTPTSKKNTPPKREIPKQETPVKKEIVPPKKEIKKKEGRKKISIKRKPNPTPVYVPPTPKKQVQSTYTPPPPPPQKENIIHKTPDFNLNQYKKKKKPWALIVGIVLALGAGAYFLMPILFGDTQKEVVEKKEIEETPPVKEEITTPTPKQRYYGFALEDYHTIPTVVKEENHIAEILEKYGLGEEQVQKVVNHGTNIASLHPLHPGRRYTVLADKEAQDSLLFLIYEPNNHQYIVLGLTEEGSAELVERKIQTKVQTVAGMMEGDETLWDAVLRNQPHAELIEKMEEALKWRVDFYHVEPGDKFKIVYDEKFEGNKSVGVGQVYAIYFNTNGKEYYAYNYEYQQEQSFYNEEARPMKSTFLMSPVKYARISSKYNLQRKHPVTGEVKGHFGTDYAAPEGSPILAVADGVVTLATFKKNNGNYVKIKHDETYSSQYLHMQKFEPGVEAGTRVKQGQIIGYVGQTGLATGPHVCFRFWKNEKQVNHLEEDLPLPNPLVQSEIPTFEMFRDSFNVVLDGVTVYN